VDVHVDVAIGVVGLEVDHLRAHQVRDRVVDRCADEDDVLLQQARVQVVGTLAAVRLLDDGGNEVVEDRVHSGSSCASSPAAPVSPASTGSESFSSRVSASGSIGWPSSSTISTCSTNQSSALRFLISERT